MNPVSISLLASLFSWAGALLGIPSAAVLLLYLLHKIAATGGPGGSAASTDFGSNPDALMLMLKGLSQTIGALAGLAASAAQFLFNALAVAALAGLGLAIVCWLTGRGLAAQAPGARFSAGALLTLVLLPSVLLALSVHNMARLIMLTAVGFCLLALHTVYAGYVSPAPGTVAH